MADGKRSRGVIAGVVAAVLAVGGGGAIAWSAGHQVHAPQPSVADAGTVDGTVDGTLDAGSAVPAPSASGSASTSAGISALPTSSVPASRGLVLAASRPVSIAIPAIAVRSRVNPVGLAADGSVDVPQPGPHYDEAAWFTGSPTPGQLGPAIIEGHVDSAAQGPSVFFKLGGVHIGDAVDVTRADGTVARFAVTAVRRYPKDAFPTSLVYGDTAQAALRIITCGGAFDTASGHYRDNVVVFAHLVSNT